MAASVSSLDQDMRNIRLSRYTPAASNEVRKWIETTLGESLPSGDLLEVLRDGVALCKLANLVLPPPGIKYKTSSMPFMQMENISHFLKACEIAPLNLPAHDRFLTVDLFEGKDPAQVLQCLGAFSRQAHAAKPHVFRTAIGPKKTGIGAMSPASTGDGAGHWQSQAGAGTTRSSSKPQPVVSSYGVVPGTEEASDQSSHGIRRDTVAAQTGPVSSWSKKSDESSTAPAWNIHQYGYLGGASQGNQGVAFGARRQIVSNAPSVPSLAEKERIRKEKAAQQQREQAQAEEDERKRKFDREIEEEKARAEESQRWEEETRRLRDEERRGVEEQKRQWEEQERRWKEEEETRLKEDAELKAMQKRIPDKPHVPSSSILRGQTLSQYQRDQAALSKGDSSLPAETPEQARVRELERQLEEARERERQYQAEREERLKRDTEKSRSATPQADTRPQSEHQSDTSWVEDEREHLRKEWKNNQTSSVAAPTKTVPEPQQPPPFPSRPVHQQDPQTTLLEKDHAEELPPAPPQHIQSTSVAEESSTQSIPPPQKEAQTFTTPSQNRTDRFLANNIAPVQSGPRISSSQEAGDTSLEQQRYTDTRLASQQKTKAGGWASKSLLEREMERERERQREWEADQEKLKSAPRDALQGIGAGQTWDVNQYGYMGGDNMNRGSSAGSGINFGAARRQILGPREMNSSKRP